MNDENIILAYKLNKNEIEIIEEVIKQLNKNIVIKSTSIPQDIVAVPSFMCFVNVNNETAENKNFVLENVKDVKNYVACIVIDKNTFLDLNLLKLKILGTYKRYNSEQQIESDSLKYLQKVKEYQKDHSIGEDDFDFSELDMVTYFDDSRVETKRCIINNVKFNVIYNTKLAEYIDFDSKKELPIDYKVFTKNFFEIMMNTNCFVTTLLSYTDDKGMNPRKLEIEQLVKLCNIIAEEIYINKYNVIVGNRRIEQLVIKKNDVNITDEHLIACRLSREELIINWLPYIKEIIQNYTGNEYNIFQYEFKQDLWEEIRMFIRNFAKLPLWKNREITKDVFEGKSDNNYWKIIFRTGKTKNNVQVLDKPINIEEILKK